MLNSLLDFYKEVKSAIKFGRKIIILDEVIAALRSWELVLRSNGKIGFSGESLNVQGMSKERNNQKNIGKSRNPRMVVKK